MQFALNIKRISDTAILPKKATKGAACFDLHADILEPIWITQANPCVISTGLIFEVPEGYALMLYSRSGHGFKHNVRLANAVGVLDSDYRGAAKIKLTADNESYQVIPGERIAQAMLIPLPEYEIVEVDELSLTERGAGGFGSSGK